jgi:ATP-dependent Lon protease
MEDNIFKNEKLERLPMVPLRDVVVFPHTMVPVVVGRKPSLKAVEQARLRDKKVYLVTQRDAKLDDPAPDEMNLIGSVANIIQSLRLPNGNLKLLVEGVIRGKTVEAKIEDGCPIALIETIDVRLDLTPEIENEMGKAVALIVLEWGALALILVGIGFAVPSNMARSVVEQLAEYGEVRRGRHGQQNHHRTP